MKKIMIVEDDKIVNLDIQRAVKKLGYKAGEADSFEEGLKVFNTFKPDLIIMDINLGKNEKSGIDLAKEIRKISDTAILYLTAYNDKETISEAMETSPEGFLKKPFNDSYLENMIDKVFNS